jgi:hypothetical protein
MPKKLKLKALRVVAVDTKQAQPLTNLPVVRLYYPYAGKGKLIQRIIRVTEMDDVYIRGFEIADENDTSVGKYKVFLYGKVTRSVQLIRFEPNAE